MIQVEIDGDRNQCLSFRPLQRRIRGRFDFHRDPEPQSKLAAADYPGPIPGQRLGFANGKGFIEEPLHEDEHQVIRERLEKKGYRLAPKREEFEADQDTWLFWLQRAVEAGTAKIVKGKFPAIDSTKAKKDFVFTKQETPTDKLAAALDRQTAAIQQLIAKINVA